MPSLNSPIITGDVSGGLHSTSVDKLKGQPVAATTPASGQVLTWDGTQWVGATNSSGGGGGANGLTYYLRQDVDADAPTTNLPGTPKQLGRTGAVAQTSITSGTLTNGVWTLLGGYVSEAVPIDPNITAIPGGLWDLNLWALGTANTNSPTRIRAKVYTYNGADAPTLLATSGEQIINTVSAQYSVSVLVPQTTVELTTRIYIAIEVQASANNHTATLQFGDGTPSHVHTSLPLVGGTGLWKNVAGVLQSPASLLVNADVDAAAAIAQSKIAGLTDALGAKAAQAQVDVYSTAGTFTWSKPANAKLVHIQCIGGGGGGGSGCASVLGVGAGGGGGGGSGARSFMVLDAALLASTETVTVGAFGAGGAGVATGAAGQSGNGGGNGTASSFGASPVWVYAGLGGGGGAGTSIAGGTGGSAAIRGLQVGFAGGAASATLATGAAGANGTGGAPASGGGGGGINAAGTISNAGTGGFQFAINGATAAATPVNTAGFAVPANSPYGGSGGGGGTGSKTANGSNGGAGGLYGAGGGGGGPTIGFTSGSGGNGAPGIVIVTTYF